MTRSHCRARFFPHDLLSFLKFTAVFGGRTNRHIESKNALSRGCSGISPTVNRVRARPSAMAVADPRLADQARGLFLCADPGSE